MASQRATRRVVLVDDEEALVWSLASRLAKVRPWDTFETANDGASALALLRVGTVDLLVADIRMPGMNGIDLVLTARAALPELPVVLMTAFKPDEIQRLSTVPFTGLLEKPFEFDRLLELMDQALTPPQVGFSGAISVQTLPDIVQLYALSSATGLLTVRHGEDLGELWFEHGHIRHAVVGPAFGDDAVYAAMMWSGGDFSMRIGATSKERSVSSSWQELLMESCRRVDERRRGDEPRKSRPGWTQSPPPPDDLDFSGMFPDFESSTPSVLESLVSSSPSREATMNIKDTLAKLNTTEGFVGAAVVDGESGMLLGQEGGASFNLEIAAASVTDVVRANRKAIDNLGLKDTTEDILIARASSTTSSGRCGPATACSSTSCSTAATRTSRWRASQSLTPRRTCTSDRTEMSEKHPIDLLVQEASARRSGEFIFATSALEVHVFLQRGRAAWATDSLHPFEFTRFLKARCRIEDEAFREVLEECRRSRAPLGQMLVAWELSTWDDIRASLRHQLDLALGSLASSSIGASMFLTRARFAEYDERLTFDSAELIEAHGDEPVSEAVSDEPPPVSISDLMPPESASAEPSPGRASASASARELLDAIRGASWVTVEGAGDLDVATRGPQPALPASLAERTLGDGADFVALRSSDGCLIGVRSMPSGERGFWCMLDGDSKFNAALATVASRGLLRKVARPAAPATSAPVAWRQAVFDPSWAGEVEQVFAYGREVLAVVLLCPDGRVVAGMGREGVDEEAYADIVKRRARVFGTQAKVAAGGLEALGFRFRTMVTGETSVRRFGAETLGTDTSATLWVLVGREASQGVGWACLTALLRRCAPPAEKRR